MASTDALTRAGLNLIQQALSIFDSDLRLVVVNAPMQAMFNLPDALVTPGAHFEQVIRFLAESGEYGEIDDLEEFIAARVTLARAFEPHYMERTRANGRTISVEGAPLPQGGWVTVYTDITAVKAQEQLLRTRSEVLSEEILSRSEELAAANRQLASANAALTEARRELTEIEARTRLTTEMMPAHIARVDAEGRYTFSNKRLSSVLPGRASEILGLHIRDALGPEAHARVAPHLERAYAGRQSTFEFTDSESSRRIRVVFTPDPLEPGVYILSQDVTEETQTRAALQQTRRREMAAQLISGLAHDFANLLTIILGLQSKLARLAPGPETDPLIAGTIQAARRGGTLLDRIADITSPRRWQPEPVVLGRFLADLETLATASLPEGLRLTAQDETRGRLLLDAGLLQDAALNLILNARDACGDRGEITLTLREMRDTWLDMTVSDTGPGFSPEALKQALQPFFTTKGENGSGLGLAMVYDMAKLAGGEVRLRNAPGGGAVVTLRLPLRPARPIADRGLALLVEDSTALREQIREMLTGMGYAVAEAVSVAEARALAEGLPQIAFVLSDVTLEGSAPGTRLVGALPDVPVLLMTSLPPDAPLCIEAHRLAPVLAKPFDADALAAFLGHERTHR
jgi:signal transduction histidine kinase